VLSTSVVLDATLCVWLLFILVNIELVYN